MHIEFSRTPNPARDRSMILASSRYLWVYVAMSVFLVILAVVVAAASGFNPVVLAQALVVLVGAVVVALLPLWQADRLARRARRAGGGHGATVLLTDEAITISNRVSSLTLSWTLVARVLVRDGFFIARNAKGRHLYAFPLNALTADQHIEFFAFLADRGLRPPPTPPRIRVS